MNDRARRSEPLPLLSVVVPIHNEEACISAFHQRTKTILDGMPVRYEIVYVNDGSRDRSMERLQAIRAESQNVAVIDLSRNFGKEIALSAGLDHAAGDAVVIIDADLQDPPELIPDLFARWQDGFDNVYAQRLSRSGETAMKRATAHAFYRIINRISEQSIPLDTGDYRLLSRRALTALQTLRERHRFMKGLYAWVGFDGVAVPYHREPRIAGRSTWNYWKLWNLSLEGITSFSTLPLRIVSYIGFIVSLLALFYGFYIVVRTIAYGNPVAGYPSLLAFILFLGGVQLLSLGIIGEYLGRIFNETKGRPLYIVASHLPSRQDRDARVGDMERV
ncbi:MAG TPA: glycosyltransferase family 2 protein [Acetobacteraceae bacterium]|jgi:glycosyltransferase involved in cell wall biosynthesis|nr:glycosyltransferase family 2 protein [Acetobacteraceae bacterium]